MNDNAFKIPEDVDVTTYAGAIDVYENIFNEEVSNKIISIVENADKMFSSALILLTVFSDNVNRFFIAFVFLSSPINVLPITGLPGIL